eukprot:SAG31_NODE_3689_length_3986_cov_45.648572_2_plen_487_part_00
MGYEEPSNRAQISARRTPKSPWFFVLLVGIIGGCMLVIDFENIIWLSASEKELTPSDTTQSEILRPFTLAASISRQKPRWVKKSKKIAKCVSESDCGNAGDCDMKTGKCSCDVAWTGPLCTQLALLPSSERSGFRREDRSSWGGSVVQAGGKYHMYVSDMVNGCSLQSWQSASQITHAVSDEAVGPYQVVDVVKERFAHNPTVHKTADGYYVIYHIDQNDIKLHDIEKENCTGDFRRIYAAAKRQINMKMQHRAPATLLSKKLQLSTTEKRTITTPEVSLSVTEKKHLHPQATVSPKMLYSKSPHGPWEYINSDEKWGDKKCNNPAAAMHAEDGMVLLYCKFGAPSHYHYGIYKAANWRGPYKFQKMVNEFIQGEDAYVWYSKKRDTYHMLYHTVPAKRPQIAWSKNGIDDWQTHGDVAFSKTIQLSNGYALETLARERHQLLLSPSGEPMVLFNGVKLGGGDGYSFTSAQPIRTDISQIPIDVAL